MSIAVSGRRLAPGGVVAGLGGIVSILGAFIPVESASVGGQSFSSSFFDGNAGKTILVASLIALALVAAWLSSTRATPNRIVPVVIILAGAAVLLAVVSNWGQINDDVNLANQFLPGAAAVGIGLYLTAVGGAMLVLGGVMGLLSREG